MDNQTLTNIRSMFGWRELQTPQYIYEFLNSEFPTALKIPSKELVGIEVEVENVHDWKTSDIWSAKEDGSLRNYGVEYISIPIPADTVHQALLHLFHDLLPEDPVFSKRTSIHIHLNIQDLNVEEIKYLIYLYTIFEKCFYRLVEKERRQSIFCIPLQDTQLLNIIKHKKLLDPLRLSWHKYCGLNILPIKTLGTLEFRHLHGTNNLEFITDWVTLIVYMKEFIKTVDKEGLNSIINTLNTTSMYYAFANNVFKNKANLIFANPNFKKEMEEGVSFLKTEIFENSFKNTIQHSFHKKSPLYQLINKKYDKKKALSDFYSEEADIGPASIQLQPINHGIQLNQYLSMPNTAWTTAETNIPSGTITSSTTGDF